MLGEYVKEELSKKYELKPRDIGECAKLSKKGMTFETKSYSVEGIGNMCVMTMKAMMGLMKMETVVLSVNEKDAPLINLDWIKVMGKETLMCELYDTQIDPYSEEPLLKMQKLSDEDKIIEDYVASGKYWYDDILYPCSYKKTGKQLHDRFEAVGKKFFDIYFDELQKLPGCDVGGKREKNQFFAETLFSKGGPAVDQVKKLFGETIAKKLVVNCMYGVE